MDTILILKCGCIIRLFMDGIQLYEQNMYRCNCSAGNLDKCKKYYVDIDTYINTFLPDGPYQILERYSKMKL